MSATVGRSRGEHRCATVSYGLWVEGSNSSPTRGDLVVLVAALDSPAIFGLGHVDGSRPARIGYELCAFDADPVAARFPRARGAVAGWRRSSRRPGSMALGQSVPRCHGPVMANVMPGVWMLTKSHS